MADFEAVLQEVLDGIPLGFHLCEEQKECLWKVVKGDHVLCVLPTGFGKSICYQLAPLVCSRLSGTHKVALVISPLLGLMANQVHELNRLGIRSLCIRKGMSQDDYKGLRDCDRSIYFASPEIIQGKEWSQLLTKAPWKDRLCLVACDEAHCISEWGEDFRPSYKNVKVLRSLAPRGCSFLALTATATTKVVTDIKAALLLPAKTHEIVRPPNRPNIHITVKTGPGLTLRMLLADTITDIKQQGYNAQKTIVYCRSLKEAADAYEMLFVCLGNAVHPSGRKVPSDKTIDLYDAEVGPTATTRILETFVDRDCHLRCLVCTIAFGMGMQIPNVRKVLHWGCSKSVLSYWQEIGRAGRDHQPASAVMYATGQSLRWMDADMRHFMTHISGARTEGRHMCLRKELIGTFYGCDEVEMEDLSADCCSNCDKQLQE